ncbi:MAG: hypothetical protein FJX30_04035 [Alphaproteobacteria bacterium]|nr:hypothetical protein [Alphaproteobacteria bacterium]
MLLFFDRLYIFILKICLTILLFLSFKISIVNAQNFSLKNLEKDIQEKMVPKTASSQANSNRKTTTTTIRSDIIDIKQKSKKIDFIKNVIVEKQDSSLLANKMTVYYRDKNDQNFESSNSSNIKEIKAFGEVKMFNDEYTASSDFAIFEPSKNIIVLEKNVIVNNGTSILNGESFVYNLETKKGQIFGEKKSKKIIDKSINNNSNSDRRVTVIIGDDINDQPKIRKKTNY